MVGFFSLFGAAPRNQSSAPIRLDLAKPGDALIITLEGKHVGGLRVDSQGRLGIYGPNHSSTVITIDVKDRVQIDPHPAKSPPVRLTVADDVWMSGVLRVGRADAFGEAPFDPNGAIQVGRNLPKAQPMSVFRAFGQGQEQFRLGITKDGQGFWSNGPHDTPLVTFRGRSEDNREQARVDFHAPINDVQSKNK